MTETVSDSLAEGLRQIEEHIALLRFWQGQPWSEVCEAAKAVGPMVLAQLTGCGLWDGLPAHEQAAVYWAMAEGHSVSSIGPDYVDPDRDGPRVRDVHDAADYFTSMCATHRYPRDFDRKRAGRTAFQFAERFTRLPEGWRAEVMRRILNGRDAGSAVSHAQISINFLHSVYGSSLAWSARPVTPAPSRDRDGAAR
ncbi:hypothetical protein OG607_28165 [Streptomyces sp. NBC_01537]|uniref:hypothetical protein n=1 Tax=Streptomyces sp. NBC_01537 TaxID=2903896 RepID=UPI003864E6D2